MKPNNTIERYGGIIKKEPLSCIENELILKETCVVEAVSPYFGYYYEVKSSMQPHMVYFVLNGYYTLEHLTRATSKIQKKVNFPIDAATGFISLLNQTCYVIRFLNLRNYNHIKMIQQYYMDEGLLFKKKKLKLENQMALIKLRRFFKLKNIGNGLYMDQNQESTGYFVIDSNIEWEQFKQLTQEVKRNTKLLFFDAARAYIYEERQITDMVRIYRENLTHETLETIKERYLKVMSFS